MSTTQNSTECGVCFEEMKEPRSLPCGHTYCRQCLQELVDRANNVMCPIDRSLFPVPAGNANKLMRNYSIESLLDNLRKKREHAAAAKVNRAKHKDRQDEFFYESSAKSDCNSCVSKHKKHDFFDYSESRDQCALRIEQLQADVRKFKQAVDNEKFAKSCALEAQVAAAVSKIREIVQVLNATADGLQNKAAQCRQLIQADSASKLATLDGLQREVVALSNAAFSFTGTADNDCTLESRLKQVHELTQKLEGQRGKLASENTPDVSRLFSDSQLTGRLEIIMEYATKLEQNLTKDTHDYCGLQQWQAAMNETQQQKQILVLAGGTNNDDALAYDTSSDTWATVAKMSCHRVFTAATLWQGKVVVAGGWNTTDKCLNTVEQFDPESNSWTALPDMLHTRQWLALACLDNTLYAIGGTDGVCNLDSVERYYSNTKRWQLAAPLNVQRVGLCCAVLGVKILAVGGIDNNSNRLATCELFDSARQKWTFAASLQTVRCGASASTVDEKVYVFGGFDKDYKYLDSVEEYAAGRWTLLLVRLSVARWGLATATVNGRVYVCGGDPEGLIVECFDASNRQISGVAQLPKNIDGAAAASVAVSDQVWSRLSGLARHKGKAQKH